jgi:hypothetical protein
VLSVPGQKNHYLPVFYLKQWCSPRDGRLCEYSRPHEKVKPRRTYPSGTAYERGLYTFDNLPPLISDFLEQQFLLRADDRAHLALRGLIAGSVDFDTETRSAWSRFIMTILYRNPEGVALIKAKLADLINTSDLQKYWSDNIAQYSASNFETFEKFESSIKSDANMGVWRLEPCVQLWTVSVGEVLNRMVWGVIAIEHPKFPMLTSDRPLIMTNGLAHPDAHILMPISPTLVFVAAATQETMHRIANIASQSTFAKIINDRVASQARKYVYGTDDMQLRFVANRLGKKLPSTPLDQLSA